MYVSAGCAFAFLVCPALPPETHLSWQVTDLGGVARQIVVLEGGRAVEFGSHTALLAAKGRYAELWARQAMLEDALGQSDEEALR